MRRIHSKRYGTQRFDQYTSSGAGASSVTQSIGFQVWRISDATSAPYRVLKKTKAAPHSYDRKMCDQLEESQNVSSLYRNHAQDLTQLILIV